MTPAEKAEQLMYKFHEEPLYLRKSDAKICAQLLCDEIINELVPSDFKDTEIYTLQRTYWQQVKEEISKL